MFKQLTAFIFIFSLMSCSAQDLQKAMDIVNAAGGDGLTTAQIGGGLKEALDQGITKGAQRLSQKDGYFKSTYKILLPPEAREITNKLKGVPGFAQVENTILEKINRGAEDAAKKATPIFVSAIKAMTFQDAMGILMGEKNAATAYLNSRTYQSLYAEFSPVIINSLDKFKAREYWADAVNAYNRIPFVKKANPDLADYVTSQALEGLFSMVEKEELNIRKNVGARTSDLMRRVFAKQDN